MASADVERVERWFRDGDLLHPFEGDAPPSTVDLARAIASIGGVPLSPQDTRAAELAERIGRDRPLLFVLVDGLGCVFDELARPGGGCWRVPKESSCVPSFLRPQPRH